jgi:hypothetical protein
MHLISRDFFDTDNERRLGVAATHCVGQFGDVPMYEYASLTPVCGETS